MKPSKKVAIEHFKTVVLPRRVIDDDAQKLYFEKHNKMKRFYRKVQPDEVDRGEPYPVRTAGLRTFAHFGIGIGIYFLQLIILTGVFFISGMIMLMAVNAYQSDSYGIVSKTNQLVTISAACAAPVNVTVNVGCNPGQESCQALLRENCELPFYAAAGDLAMSMFIMVAIYCAKFGEKQIEEELDESVQTVQDYSVEVNDPDEDADNPDEWYDFFSRFGKVRYVTITRKNKKLCEKIIEKHMILRKISEFNKIESGKSTYDGSYWVNKKEELNKELEALYLLNYPTCRVYITYEKEEHQRLCLQQLEVPDIEAIFDIKNTANVAKMFRGKNVLDVTEPPEPDNILWENVEVSRKNRNFFTYTAYLLTLVILAACYFLISITKAVSSQVLAIVIGIVDAMLPTIFEIITDYGSPKSEGKKQSDLQVKLFLSRLMLSTVFPYVQTSWNSVLDQAFIEQIVNIQLAACFVTPILNMFDIAGLVTRNIVAPMLSDTQAELNSKWSGSEWSLADKYTGIAKIIFVSLYYGLLTPISILIATIAFFISFLVDRYLLLRRWKPVPMIDASIAVRLRQQAILAVAAHMYVTMRFIYSWPMDQAYESSPGVFEKVNKRPPLSILMLNSQDWQTDVQSSILSVYKICFFIVGSITVYVWIIDPLFKGVKRLFFKDLHIVGDSQGIEFSTIDKIVAYVPLVSSPNGEKFICSYLEDMLPHHKPSLIRSIPEEKIDLSSYVPMHHQPHVLSVVKYYGDDPEDPDGTGEKVKSDANANVPLIDSNNNNNNSNGAYNVRDSDGTKVKSLNTFEMINQRREEFNTTLKTSEEGKLERTPKDLPSDLLEKLKGTEIPATSAKSKLNSLKLNTAALTAAARQESKNFDSIEMDDMNNNNNGSNNGSQKGPSSPNRRNNNVNFGDIESKHNRRIKVNRLSAGKEKIHPFNSSNNNSSSLNPYTKLTNNNLDSSSYDSQSNNNGNSAFIDRKRGNKVTLDPIK